MIRKSKRYVTLLCASAITVIGFSMIAMPPQTSESSLPSKTLRVVESNLKTKHVLLWTFQKKPLTYLGRGTGVFHKRNCQFKNCYITCDRGFLNNITEFDAIIFHGRELDKTTQYTRTMPKERSPKQSYIFASMESSANYKLKNKYNGFFNFTWTYKLNSDLKFGYITIKNHKGEIIGPNTNISWIHINNMLPINDTIKEKLSNKKIAAAWFVSKCNTPSQREKLAANVIKMLKTFNMTVDVYGKCGYRSCERKFMEACLKKLQRDYYFYFAFENSCSGDYVTEKLLYGLQNFAVPIVYGGADYKRFMPDGIYLNARHMSVAALVKLMIRIINDKDHYHDFFKWHNHYSYHSPEEAPDTDPYCSFCSFMNHIDYNKSTTVRKFYRWWTKGYYQYS